MKENNAQFDLRFLLAAFRNLTPENQKFLLEYLKALESSSTQKLDSGGLRTKMRL